MIKKTRIMVLSFMFAYAPICAWSAPLENMLFPPAHELFGRLQADPTDPHFSFSLGKVVSGKETARIDVGDYLGIYRWAFPDDIGAIQINVGGAIFTRFDANETHNLQVIDFYGNIPLDIKIKDVSTRFMFTHDSSHLGDDYLRVNNMQSTSHSWNALRGIMSYQVIKELRLYGGATYAFSSKPGWRGRRAVQGGFEINFNRSLRDNWYPFFSNDVQCWERSSWNPTWTSQIGIKNVTPTSRGRGISYFVQMMTGPRLEGQFYTEYETLWTAGIKFALSDSLR